MKQLRHFILLLGLLLAGLPCAAVAAGGALRAGRVLVVANGASPASLEIARHYMVRRQLPPANLVLVFPGLSTKTISPADFEQRILKPVRQRRLDLGEKNIDCAVLCRDVPYRVGEFSAATALMFGGTANLLPFQGFYRQGHAFDGAIPCHYLKLLPTTVLSAYTVDEALALVDNSQMVRSDKKNGRWYFCDGEGPRGVRNPQIPAAIALLSRNGARAVREASPNTANRDDILGQFTGATWLELNGNRYLPGSILDNLTSFGGCLLDNRGQMDLLALVSHGVCGAYGTVSEPTNSPARWADYSLPARYLAGFSLMDAYLQSIPDWQYGLVVGDPLMSPFNPPPEAELTLAAPSIPWGAAASGTVIATTPFGGSAIAWAELWLNEQELLLSYVPSVPAGTEAVFEVCGDNRTIHSRRITLFQTTRIPDMLRLLVEAGPEEQDAKAAPVGTATATADEKSIELIRTGKRNDKLLVRWFPSLNRREVPGNLFCRLTLTGKGKDEQKLEFIHQLEAGPLFLPSILLEFGAVPPTAGDSIAIRFAQNAYATASATAGQSTAQLLQQLAENASALPFFGRQSRWDMEVQNLAGASRMLIHPRTPGDNPPPLTVQVTVTRAEGSLFAEKIPGESTSKPNPCYGLAEAVLSPVWPVNRIETAFSIPPGHHWPGHNELRLIVGTQAGAETTQTAVYEMKKPTQNLEFAITNPLPALQEELELKLNPGPELAKAIPELLIDGAVATAWDAGTTRGIFRLSLPHVAPGTHQIQVQWVTEAGPRSPLVPFVPLARSAPQNIFVKRPLVETTTFSPQTVTTGHNVVVAFTGPYLRDGLTFLMDGQPLTVVRDPRIGLYWNAKIPKIADGAHKFEIRGNPVRETAGELPQLLIATEPVK